jgi:DNA-binding HxlR family transcriptional regulator
MTSTEHDRDCTDEFPDSAYCAAFQGTLELLGRRWTAAIMRALFVGPLRFNEVGRLIPGISHRLLTERLAELQLAGLVERDEDGSAQLYGLSEQARDMRRIFEAVEAWNRRWLVEEADIRASG